MRKDIALILLILAMLALIIVPLGETMIDALLSVNLTLAVLLLIVAVYLKHPADFVTFPTVILLGTAFRLALSIATTRQILSEATGGQIIETFGNFVIAGNIAIGLIVFLIITVFQFLVVTKGAERVAEVSARFALDAMPGKQMSIDADLRAENIDKATAFERREKLERESAFFGSMDGAMKFVKGDAIAGLIIIFINLIGGVSVGMLIHHFSFDEAIRTYTLLTLGDGLVAQLPALLMALCAGIITTRIEGKDNVDLGSDIWRDLVTDPRVPAAAAGIVILIGLIPGFPFINFTITAGVLLLVSFSVRQVLMLEKQAAADEAAAEAQKEKDAAQKAAQHQAEQTGGEAANSDDTPRNDRLFVRLGASLADRLDLERLDNQIKGYFDRYDEVRGVLLNPPPIIISKDEDATNKFEVLLDEVPLSFETVPEDTVLIRCEQNFLEVLGCPQGEAQRARWHEFSAYWVPQKYEDAAQKSDMPVLSVEDHLSAIVFRIVEGNIGTLFSQEQFTAFLDSLSKTNAQARQEFDQKIENNTFFLTLRYMVEDGVPLRPASLIVETYTHWLMVEGNIGALAMAERMRGSLKRQICHSLSNGNGMLGAILLDPNVEETANRAVAQSNSNSSSAGTDGLPIDVNSSEQILGQFRYLTAQLPPQETPPVVIASAPIRRRMRNYLSANRISFPVLAPHELSPEIHVHPVARIQLSNRNA